MILEPGIEKITYILFEVWNISWCRNLVQKPLALETHSCTDILINSNGFAVSQNNMFRHFNVVSSIYIYVNKSLLGLNIHKMI